MMEIKNISLSYDKRIVLEDISLTLKDKSFIGIIGKNGTGKSTLLKEFGNEEQFVWDDSKCIASHFDNPQDAINRLTSVGLNSVPSWTKPYNVLSNGEKFRVNLARKIKDY